jgi:hypothetical protein
LLSNKLKLRSSQPLEHAASAIGSIRVATRFAEIPNRDLCFCKFIRWVSSPSKNEREFAFYGEQQAPAQRRWGGVGRT